MQGSMEGTENDPVPWDEEDVGLGTLTHLNTQCSLYLSDRGFTKRTISLCSDIITRLYESIQESTELPEMVESVQNFLVGNSKELSQREFHIFSEYLSTTLLQHFSLYKYLRVVSPRREVWRKEFIEEVETLEPPQPFALAIPFKVWEYEETMKAIDDEADPGHVAREEEVTQLKTDRRQLNNKLQSLVLTDDQISSIREKVREMIEESVTCQTELAERMLLHELEAAQEDLHTDIEKAKIPRPAPLGAFPLRPVPSRGAARETRDMNSNIQSRMSMSQDTSRGKSAGKSRGNKK